MKTYGSYPLKPSFMHGQKSPSTNPYCHPPCKHSQLLIQTRKLGYRELLSPLLFGTAGALFLSIFSSRKHSPPRRAGDFFKLALVLYAVGATIAASYAVTEVLTNSEPPHDKMLHPIAGALASIILFFGAEYLLLYRIFPDSFKGDVGDNLGLQFLSFLYFSITSIATGNLGDIMPNNLTARALISTEMIFYFYTMATALQIILARF